MQPRYPIRWWNRLPVLSSCFLILVLLFVALPAFASTPKVFLNGVDITGLSDQEFENATVKLDASGNVHIEAPQYRVEIQGPSGQTPAPAPASSLSAQYFLVVNHTPSGGTNFDVDVYINGVLSKTIKNEEGQVVLDITGKLLKGSNVIQIKAKKRAGSGATLASNALELFVGKGTSNPSQLTIDRKYFTFRLTGSQTADADESYTFDAF